MENNPTKSIIELNDYYFYIPNYQRGYRWDEQNCEDLLNDVLYYQNNHKEGQIYCIQPLVVQKKDNNKYDVIDGQQRLTTIYILLGYLRNCIECSGCEMVYYTIEYQTRDNSYLNQLANGKMPVDEKTNLPIDKDDNIDFYHMYLVKNTIELWFKKNVYLDKKTFYKTLVEDVHFIWYEIIDEIPTKVFSRLNEGRIGLTDAELIKALFLNQSNFRTDNTEVLHEKQLNIAMEWDNIENTLQKDEFWLFIHDNSYSGNTRIDFLFDLARKYDYFNVGNDNLHKKHPTLSYFQKAFSDANNNKNDDEWLVEYWKKVKSIYQTFEEWYNDYKLFHYIGYLITINKNNENLKDDIICDLLVLWNDSETKEDFECKVIEKIIDVFKCKEWIYYKDKDEDGNVKEYYWNTFVFYNGDNTDDCTKKIGKTDCVELLLLHNIETIVVRNEELVKDKKKSFNVPDFTRFPFHLYKKDLWEVEHIYPNAGDKIDNYDSAMIYIDYICKMGKLDNDEQNLLKQYLEIKKRNFKNVEDEINAEIEKINNKYFKEMSVDSINKNTIKNYTLLDKSTNASYGNWMFPIKRLHIINKENGKKPVPRFDQTKKCCVIEEEDGVAFILPCTKNIFTKSYSKIVENLYLWNKDDAEAYEEDICKKLENKFLEPAKQKRKKECDGSSN